MTHLNDVSEASWGYFAGYVDGDGSIQINIRTRIVNDKKYQSYYSHFSITSQNRNTLVYLRSMGDMGRIEARKRKVSGCVAYNLRYQTNELKLLLPKIIPHLYLRKGFATLLLEWLGTLGTSSHANNFPETKTIRDNIYKRFQEEIKIVRPWPHKIYNVKKRTPEEMTKIYGKIPNNATYAVVESTGSKWNS